MEIDRRKLDAAIGNACMSYEKLAEVTGISAANLSRIRSHKQKPRPSTIGRIAKALNVKVEDLVD